METILELQNVYYQYPRSGFCVRCASLSLYPGELTCIKGSNGSGKTTLSKLLCGVLRPDKGQLLVRGKNANEMPLGKIGQTVGYLFQNPGRQIFATTVWEEMTFVDGLKGMDKSTTAKRAQELLDQFGLIHLKERSVYRLSRGEKQRLAICAVLMQGAEYLILDEPTSGLDAQNRSILMTMIDAMVHSGIGAAVITHDQAILGKRNAHHIALHNGEVVCDERC